MMEKVVRGGMVAVLVSHGWGAGWYTWNQGVIECLFDPVIVDMVEKEAAPYDIEQYAEQKYGDDFYGGGADGLYIQWVPEGDEFIIDEYDGAESLHLKSTIKWIQA
jgi:hypothetical protein